ncbi:hypothetical protein MMC22_008228 [Lobaria immixta]|nr:hypothetical protein [Lobaria immixta]
MEIRRIGQTLLGSCPFQSPVLSFLAPSIPHKSYFAARNHSHLVFTLPISQRSRTAHQTIRRASSSSLEDLAAFIDGTADKKSPRGRRVAPAPSASSDPENPKAKPSNPWSSGVSSSSDGFSAAKKSNIDPKTRRFIPAAPAPSEPESPKAKLDPIDDLLSRTLQSTSSSSRRHRVSETAPQSSLGAMQDAYAKQGGIADGMMMPNVGSPSTTVSASNMVSENIIERQLVPRAVRTIHSHPSLGRTIEIDSRVDIGVALDKLKKFVQVNKIRRDLQVQRFHERPGVRRKRLQRERWRERFRENFHQAVEKIKAMRRMGW